jgi:hypothetical protein
MDKGIILQKIRKAITYLKKYMPEIKTGINQTGP